MTSFRRSTRFPLISGARVDNPVMFPPGRARLATNPFATGSLSCVMTIGIVAVAFLAGPVAPKPPVTMISTLRRASSAASAGRRSFFPSADRHSMIMFFPSTYPSSRRPCRNASMRARLADGEVALTYPIRGTFFGCCASAVTPKASNTTATRIDGTAAFFIAHLVSSVIYHADRDKGKCDLHSGRRQGFVEWKDQIQPEIELNDATVKSHRIDSSEKSVQSQ